MRALFLKVLTAFTMLLIGGYVLIFLYAETTSSTLKATCSDCSMLKEQAIRQKDFTICAKIEDEIMAVACKIEVLNAENVEFALRYSDKSYCQRIDAQPIAEDCVFKLATATKDYALCAELTSSLHDSCIAEYAETTNNADLCINEIKNEYVRDSCLRKLALRRSDQRVCSQIRTQGILLSCLVDILYRQTGLPQCIDLNESGCAATNECLPQYAPQDCLGCTGKVYLKCEPRKETICQLSGGEFEESQCLCKGKALINDFCIDCANFLEEKKALCESKIIS